MSWPPCSNDRFSILKHLLYHIWVTEVLKRPQKPSFLNVSWPPRSNGCFSIWKHLLNHIWVTEVLKRTQKPSFLNHTASILSERGLRCGAVYYPLYIIWIREFFGLCRYCLIINTSYWPFLGRISLVIVRIKYHSNELTFIDLILPMLSLLCLNCLNHILISKLGI